MTFSHSAGGIALRNLPLDEDQEIRDAWELVHAPQTVMCVFPSELAEAKERIALAAVRHDILLQARK